MRWWRRLSLRARLTLLSAAGLAVGLALGGLLIVNVLHYVLIRSVDSSTHQTASDVAAQAADNTLPASVAVAGSSIVQVVDANGAVIDYTDGTDHLVPMLNRAQIQEALRGKVLTIPGYAAGTYDGDLRVIARRVTVHDPDSVRNGEVHTVIVAGPTHAVEESIETVTRALLIAYPLLVALLSALAWLVVGWTLRPVEALRRSAEGISAGRGSAGPLPVPDGDDEIHRLAVTLNGMLDRLEAARARQRAFVADAAHELRSPITSLRTQLEVAAHLDEPVITDDLLDDLGRLEKLVADLLLLARTDEGDPKLRNVEPIDLSELVDEAVADYVGARVEVTAGTPVEPVWTIGEPIALRRVLDNLITNAVRHATTQVAVSVVQDADDDLVRLAVVDDGPGIPAADRERVFDRFTRLDNARNRDQGGAGLGLAIVRELVRVHGGTIRLSDADPGLRVEISLPPAVAPAGFASVAVVA